MDTNQSTWVIGQLTGQHSLKVLIPPLPAPASCSLVSRILFGTDVEEFGMDELF